MGPSAVNITSKPMVPSTRLRTTPAMLQMMSVAMRSQPRRMSMTMIMGSTSSTREGAVEPSSSSSGGMPVLMLRPTMANSTADMTADITA